MSNTNVLENKEKLAKSLDSILLETNFNKLGAGVTSIVLEGKFKGRAGKPVAIKIMNPSPENNQYDKDFNEEFECYKEAFRHDLERHSFMSTLTDSVVKIYDFGNVDGLTIAILEKCNGTFQKVVERPRAYTIPQRIGFLKEIAEIVNEVHENGYLYGDLKPANILISQEGNLKLTDFGGTRQLNGKGYYSYISTPEYMAPEMIDSFNSRPDWRWDIFSLGVIAYQLFSEGKLPREIRKEPEHRYADIKYAPIPQSTGLINDEKYIPLDSFVIKLLHSSSRKRRGYNSMNEVINDLSTLISIYSSE